MSSAVIWTWHGYDTHELTPAVIIDRRATLYQYNEKLSNIGRRDGFQVLYLTEEALAADS